MLPMHASTHVALVFFSSLLVFICVVLTSFLFDEIDKQQIDVYALQLCIQSMQRKKERKFIEFHRNRSSGFFSLLPRRLLSTVVVMFSEMM